MRKLNSIMFVFLATVLCVGTVEGAIVFQDSFNDPCLPAWATVEAGPWDPNDPNADPSIASDLGVAHEPYLVLPYRTIKASLSETITSFKVNWKWLPAAWRQIGYLFLTNADGSQGYGVRWNCTFDDPPGYEPGYVNFIKWDDPNGLQVGRSPEGRPESASAMLPASVYLSGRSIDLPFAEWQFELNDEGKLDIWVTDATHGPDFHATVTDTDFNSFSRIYLTTSFYSAQPDFMLVDELQVSPWEALPPATCPEVIAGGYKLAADLNDDCYVNLEDYAMVASLWLVCNDPEDEVNCTPNWPTW